MQQLMNAGKVEQYWYYSINNDSGVKKTRTFFNAVNAVPMYSNPDNLGESE